MMDSHEDPVPVAEATRGRRSRAFRSFMLVMVGVLLAGGLAARMVWTAQQEELRRARGALELQVLASRLGAAAFEAEYGNHPGASEIARGVFDGIVNYGIEQGALPENYARVLRSRDEVMVGLSQGRPEVASQLVELFFLLQLPAATELDSRSIIPATDSGFGMAPPVRRAAPEVPDDTIPPPTLRMEPAPSNGAALDTRPTVVPPADTSGALDDG